jgi:hypothetical protein
MKKKIAVLGALGVAGGLLYLLESQHKRNKSERADENSSVSGNGGSVPQSRLRQDGARQPKPAASMARIENGQSASGNEREHAIDDRGTDQAKASQILKHIRDNAFDASDEKLAVALGRPTQEIEEWTSGNGLIDGDLILKARALAMQRGFEI